MPFYLQAVCNTLQEFSSRTTSIDTHSSIMGELASIIEQHCSDVAWGVDLLSPLVLSVPVPDKRLTTALMHILEKGEVLHPIFVIKGDSFYYQVECSTGINMTLLTPFRVSREREQ